MTTPTTNYGWGKPVNGSDTNTWGPEVNTIFDSIDSTVFTVSGVASAALPKAGGVMTGRVDAKNATMAATILSGVTGSQVLDMSTANYFALVVTGAVTLSLSNVPSTAAAAVGLILAITNGGTRITWPASFKWAGGTGAPALTTSGVDVLAFITDNQGTAWRQVGIQLNIS